ncbi:MAG: hypothetical protein ABH871_01575 [Pseudomonadota bacterium]
MTVEKLQDLFKGNAKPKASKVKGMGGGDFDVMLDAVSAMGPTATTSSQMYGSGNSSAVLAAAFSGISSGAQTLGGATPSFAGGYGAGAQFASTGSIGTLDPNAAVVPGTEGFSQMDMINTMNQNNLQLLELQATMQSNMQGWNTKSNILSADHRARMAMIEKFTARG